MENCKLQTNQQARRHQLPSFDCYRQAKKHSQVKSREYHHGVCFIVYSYSRRCWSQESIDDGTGLYQSVRTSQSSIVANRRKKLESAPTPAIALDSVGKRIVVYTPMGDFHPCDSNSICRADTSGSRSPFRRYAYLFGGSIARGEYKLSTGHARNDWHGAFLVFQQRSTAR